MSGKPGGYVGQAVLDGFADRPCYVSLRFVPPGQLHDSRNGLSPR
jgi:hypothetical protein